MPHTITRRLEFDAAHRLINHEGKCKNLHGHRYAAEISFEAGLDELGRVIDYAIIKELIGGWIDNHWDHNIILHQDDPLLCRQIMQTETGRQSKYFVAVFGNKMPYIMKVNPTAENLSADLFYTSRLLLNEHKQVTVTSVRLYETPSCSATYP